MSDPTYSLRNVILHGNQYQDTFEQEVSRRIARNCGYNPAGTFIPLDALHKEIHTRDLSTAGGAAQGAVLVQSSIEKTADVLRPYAASIAAGATVLNLDGIAGAITIPRLVTGTFPFFTAENATSYPGSGNATFSSLVMTPHRLTDEIRISKQLVTQAQFSITEFIQSVMLSDIGSVIDFAALAGNPSVNASQPTGILSMSENSGLPLDYGKLAGPGTTFGGAATYSKLVGMVSSIMGNNVTDDGTMGWVISPSTYGKWALAPKVATFPIFLIDSDQEIAGYPYYVTSNLSSTNQAIFGRWSDLIIAIFYIDILSDPYSLGGAGQIKLTINVGLDVGLLRPTLIRSEDTAAA